MRYVTKQIIELFLDSYKNVFDKKKKKSCKGKREAKKKKRMKEKSEEKKKNCKVFNIYLFKFH